LECFVDGMAFDGSERLKFEPSDEIIKVYRAIYGGKTPLSDAMECETFLEKLESEFKVNIVSLSKEWYEEITLILENAVDFVARLT